MATKLEEIPAPDQAAWHHLDISEIARNLQTDATHGLAAAEAAARLAHFGPNTMSPRKGLPAWRRFLLQFHQPLVYILLAACVVTASLQE
jgi:Ca2+-transporting ATPase